MTATRYAPPAPLRERLYRSLQPCPDPGCECLLWTRSTDRKGYGRMGIGGHGSRKVPVHRVAYELEVGPIPDGLVIDHVKDRGCTHRNCANVAHLEPVTNEENLRRGKRPGPPIGPIKTHCLRGHEYTPENTYWFPGRPRARSCRTCMRMRESNRARK